MRTAVLCLCALALSLLAATCEPQVPPTDPTPPDAEPPDEPTRQELCVQVCERYERWGCEKADVCAEFSDVIGDDGSLTCLAKRPCPQDCVQNPGAWPESLRCVLELGTAGPVSCKDIEAACPLP